MKRFYHNMTNEPMKYRSWLLLQETVGEDDFKWLKAFDIPIRVDEPKHAFNTVNDGIWLVQGKVAYTLDTTTDKQRDMLILKYGSNVLLMQEEIVMPGTFSTCTLSGVSW